MNEEIVVADNSNTAEEVVLETTENVEATTEQTNEVIDWEARAKKAEELANNQKIRAEKAEKLAKSVKTEVKQDSSISTKDLYALTKANVSEDDISDVEEYARFKKISISEALKSSTLKAILSEKEENRLVANATSVSNSKRTSGKISDESLLDKARKGDMPSNDSDIVRLIKLRKGIK